MAVYTVLFTPSQPTGASSPTAATQSPSQLPSPVLSPEVEAKPSRSKVHKDAAAVPPQPSMSQECAPGASCAQSSGQQGGITAGTVNNFSDKFPRPGVVPTVTMCVTDEELNKTAITIQTDSPITAPYWWFAFDGAVSYSSLEMIGVNEPYGFTHTPLSAEQSTAVQVPIDQTIGVQITEIGPPFGGPWRPLDAKDKIRVTITSPKPVKITHVEPGAGRQHLEERIVFNCVQ